MDLGAIYDISETKMYFQAGDRHDWFYKIEYSTADNPAVNDPSWTLLADYTKTAAPNIPGPHVVTRDTAPVQARHMRVTLTGIPAGTTYWYTFAEFEAYGTLSRVLEDTEAVASAKTALTWDAIRGVNTSQSEVTANLTLPLTGLSGTSIAWSSNKPAVISINGTVTLPKDVNVDVILTAAITKGTASDTQTFNLTVRRPVFNLAYGKPVLPLNSKGDEVASVGAENITDGSTGTSWTSTAGTSLRIDLGLQSSITGIGLSFAADTVSEGSVVTAYSADGESFTPYGTAQSAPSGGGTLSLTETAQARYLLLTPSVAGIKITSLTVTGSISNTSGVTKLIVAPHPDDESLAFAGVIKRAIADGGEVAVLLTTSGDYNGIASGRTRMKETIAAMELLGLDRDKIYFMTFPDIGGLDSQGGQDFRGSMTYTLFTAADPDAPVKRRDNGNETYNGDTGYGESVRSQRTGNQGPFTRNTFLADLEWVIDKINPDELYTLSNCDLHGDHAALELFVNEAILDMQKRDPAFQPTMLSALVHAPAGDNVWPVRNSDSTGIKPFEMPAGLETKTILDWNKRVSITVPDEMRVIPFTDNLKTQTISKYPSQMGAEDYLKAFAKWDEIFWARKYDSIAHFAAASASSQKPGDYDTSPAKAVDGIRDGYSESMINSSPFHRYPRLPFAEWVSNGDGQGAWLRLDWNGTCDISAVTLYDRPLTGMQIKSGTLWFSDGSTVSVPELPADGRPLTVTFLEKTGITWLKLEVNDCVGTDVGLAEIEVQGTYSPRAEYTYTVTFDKNGGMTEADPATKTVQKPALTVDALPTPPEPSAANLQFAGWKTARDGSGTSFTERTVLTGDLTVYAQWEPVILNPVNVALNKSASQSTGGNTAPNGNDGNTTANGPFNGGTPSAPVWWKVDLGDIYDISETKLYFNPDDARHDFKYKIEYSAAESPGTTDASWIMLADYTTNAAPNVTPQVRTLDAPVQARHIRVTLTGVPEGTTYWYTFAEFEAYGIKVPAQTEDQTAVESAKEIIEAVAYTVPQADANTADAVKAWLETKLAALEDFAATGVTLGEIAISSFVPAVVGTSEDVGGTNGSYSFTAALSKVGATGSATKTGVITATAYVPPQPTVIGGSVSITGTAVFDQMLTANISAVTPSSATLAYQWTRDGVETPISTESTYKLTADDIGKVITLTVTGTGEYTGTLSVATEAVAKVAQASPIGLGTTPVTAEGGSDGVIIGVTTAMEYKTRSAENWTPCTATTVTGLAAGEYWVRYAETDTRSASTHLELTVPAYNAPPQAAIPKASFDAATMILSDVTAGMKYSVDGGTTWIAIDGTSADLSECALITDNGIRVYLPGDGELTSDSNQQLIALTQADAPTTVGKTDETEAIGDGSLTGVRTAMEYKAESAENWMPCTDTAVTGLAAGAYLVRVKGVGTVLASESVSVTIAAYLSPVAVTHVTLNKNIMLVYKGNQAQLIATVTPGDAANKAVTWSSSNTAVATLDQNGLVTAAADGTANITVTSVENGSISATCVVTVTIPTAQQPRPSEVAVIVRPDGTWEIVKTSIATEDGMRVTLTKGATLEIVDNSKAFIDVASADWFDASVQFVTSRELMNGIGAEIFAPEASTSRAMLMTILARLDGQDAAAGENWYSVGMEWAKETGISDGTNPDTSITREQLAAMLYRYAKAVKTKGDLSRFSDADQVSTWAAEAMVWAVESGIIQGANGKLNPTATRAEVAAMLERFVVLARQA